MIITFIKWTFGAQVPVIVVAHVAECVWVNYGMVLPQNVLQTVQQISCYSTLQHLPNSGYIGQIM